MPSATVHDLPFKTTPEGVFLYFNNVFYIYFCYWQAHINIQTNNENDISQMECREIQMYIVRLPYAIDRLCRKCCDRADKHSTLHK